MEVVCLWILSLLTTTLILLDAYLLHPSPSDERLKQHESHLSLQAIIAAGFCSMPFSCFFGCIMVSPDISPASSVDADSLLFPSMRAGYSFPICSFDRENPWPHPVLYSIPDFSYVKIVASSCFLVFKLGRPVPCLPILSFSGIKSPASGY